MVAPFVRLRRCESAWPLCSTAIGSAAEVRINEVRAVEVRAEEVRVSEIRAKKVRASEIRAAEVGRSYEGPVGLRRD